MTSVAGDKQVIPLERFNGKWILSLTDEKNLTQIKVRLGWILTPTLLCCIVTYLSTRTGSPDIHKEIQIASFGIWVGLSIALLSIACFAVRNRFQYSTKIVIEIMTVAAIIAAGFTAVSKMQYRALVLEQELDKLDRLHAKSTMSNSHYNELKMKLEAVASIKPNP